MDHITLSELVSPDDREAELEKMHEHYKESDTDGKDNEEA